VTTFFVCCFFKSVERHYLKQVVRAQELFFKALNKGGVGILFEKPIHIHIGKPIRCKHIPEQRSVKEYIPHAQCKLMVQEGTMAEAFLGCLIQGHVVYVQKVKVVNKDASRHGHLSP
jgi:hypothetical protein